MWLDDLIKALTTLQAARGNNSLIEKIQNNVITLTSRERFAIHTLPSGGIKLEELPNPERQNE